RVARASRVPASPPCSVLIVRIPVEAVLADVLDDPVWHQVPDGLSLAGTGPAVCRGDRQRRDLDRGHGLRRQPLERQTMPWSCNGNKVRQLEQFLRILPG